MSALKMASSAIQAAAAGVSFGRNVFSSSSPAQMIRCLDAIVHHGMDPETAFANFSLES
jgi:class I fructose-bisphosphate aldolase